MRVTEIQRRIEDAKDLDFGTIFSQSIDVFKKVWVQGLVTLLLNMLLAIPIIMVFYIPLVIMGISDAYENSNNSFDTSAQLDISPIMFLVMGVLYLFLIVAMSTIGFALKAAFYRICKMRDQEKMGREDYFYFFKKPYLEKTIKLTLAFIGISILAMLLCVIPLIYAFVPLSLITVIYAFNPDMPISEIINLSFKLGNKKWLITFGLLFVSGLLAGLVGFLMCGVGMYVTASFSYLPVYIIYKDVVGFDDEDETKKIEQHESF
jgi:hypothetical protein